jgi:hypothetical protein
MTAAPLKQTYFIIPTNCARRRLTSRVHLRRFASDRFLAPCWIQQKTLRSSASMRMVVAVQARVLGRSLGSALLRLRITRHQGVERRAQRILTKRGVTGEKAA